MSDKFIHYHVNINESLDAIKTITEEDKANLAAAAQSYAELAKNMALVNDEVASQGPKAMMAWGSAIMVVFIQGTIVVGCIAGLAWLVKFAIGVLGG